MEETPSICLSLLNEYENLDVVQGLLAGTAAAVGLDALGRDDLQTAVMEACKNVVWHAYEGQRGPLELELYSGSDLLEVVVRDHGIGIRPHLGERRQPHTGIGMPIAHLLTRRITYTNLPEGGTEVRMEFVMPALPASRERAGGPVEAFFEGLDPKAGVVVLALAQGAICRAVLPRVLAALAERAGLAQHALSELRLGAPGLVGLLEEKLAGDRLLLDARIAEPGLHLRLGPLLEGSTAALAESARSALGAGLVPAGAMSGTHPPDPGEMLLFQLRAGA